ncbi:hypothetical protein EVAR_62479_1 [Eumeta japonica]|uniref:Uncharacterized protein n=1 Tax=Eumeta variegata TaxID=151549 RepID=A0A4C1ZKY8_EUMVA|nr:hypothetical protein EVAR_62479_1 [Eumeta japonica]
MKRCINVHSSRYLSTQTRHGDSAHSRTGVTHLTNAARLMRRSSVEMEALSVYERRFRPHRRSTPRRHRPGVRRLCRERVIKRQQDINLVHNPGESRREGSSEEPAGDADADAPAAGDADKDAR